METIKRMRVVRGVPRMCETCEYSVRFSSSFSNVEVFNEFEKDREDGGRMVRTPERGRRGESDRQPRAMVSLCWSNSIKCWYVQYVVVVNDERVVRACSKGLSLTHSHTHTPASFRSHRICFTFVATLNELFIKFSSHFLLPCISIIFWIVTDWCTQRIVFFHRMWRMMHEKTYPYTITTTHPRHTHTRTT